MLIVLDRALALGYAATIDAGAQASTANVGQYRAGTRLVLSCRSSALYSTDRDGPYLRISPITSTQDSPFERNIQVSKGETLSASQAGPTLTVPVQPAIWPYDIDPEQPVILPFDANVQLVAVSPGFWAYEAHAWRINEQELATNEHVKSFLRSRDAQDGADEFYHAARRWGHVENARDAMASVGGRNDRFRCTYHVVNGTTRIFGRGGSSFGAAAGAHITMLPRGVQEVEFGGAITAMTLGFDSAADAAGTGMVSYFGTFGTLAAPIVGTGNRQTFSAGKCSFSTTTNARVIFWVALP